MKPVKAYRKRHTRSKRTYVSLTMSEKDLLEDVRERYRTALGHDLSAALIISTALSVLANDLQQGRNVPAHPDAYLNGQPKGIFG
jgi:hypothetical protein